MMYGSPHSVSTWAAIHRENLMRRARNRVILSLVGFVALAGTVHMVARLAAGL